MESRTEKIMRKMKEMDLIVDKFELEMEKSIHSEN